MAQKPSYEALLKKIDSLQNEVKRHRKREDVFWRIQERLTQIVESIPIPTFVLDNDHVVIHYNPAMENLTGIASDEIYGTRDAWKAFYGAARPTMAALATVMGDKTRSRNSKTEEKRLPTPENIRNRLFLAKA